MFASQLWGAFCWRYPGAALLMLCVCWRSADNYTGHQEEKGYNAIMIDSARDCWVRRVRVIDCDNGILVQATERTTVR